MDNSPAVVPPAAPIAPYSPAQNSMQRWGAFAAGQPNPQPGGIMPLSNARRYFDATNRIDGRAPQAQTQDGLQTGPAQGYRSVQFNNSPSNWNTGSSNWSPL